MELQVLRILIFKIQSLGQSFSFFRVSLSFPMNTFYAVMVIKSWGISWKHGKFEKEQLKFI